MTEITTDDILSHYGVKGMKWGVRNDKGHEGEQIRTYRFAELDQQYADRSQMARTKFRIHNEAVRKTNAVDIARINNKPEYKSADFTQDSALRRQYYAEHQKAFVKNLRAAASDVGTNASGTKQYQIKTKPNGNWSIKLATVKHSEDNLDDDSFDVDVTYNAIGHILSVELTEKLEQSDMSDITTDDILSHYGVKGMKWGVRNDKGHEGERAKTKKIEKLDQQFANDIYSPRLIFAIHNAAAEKSNSYDIERINNKPEYKGQDFSRDSPLRRKYMKEHQDSFLDNVEKAADELGTNASGTKKYHIIETSTGGWDVVLSDVKHADDDEVVFHVDIEYDGKGHIVSLDLPKELEQSDMDEITTDDILAHYGVKGMKWGKHNSSPEQSAAKARRSERRAEIRSDTKDAFRKGAHGQKTKVGLAVASTAVLGPPGALAVGSAQMMRSAGYSRGKSAAAAIVLGPVGALALTELAVRKQTRED